jgi:hypothetical protein
MRHIPGAAQRILKENQESNSNEHCKCASGSTALEDGVTQGSAKAKKLANAGDVSRLYSFPAVREWVAVEHVTRKPREGCLLPLPLL